MCFVLNRRWCQELLKRGFKSWILCFQVNSTKMNLRLGLHLDARCCIIFQYVVFSTNKTQDILYFFLVFQKTFVHARRWRFCIVLLCVHMRTTIMHCKTMLTSSHLYTVVLDGLYEYHEPVCSDMFASKTESTIVYVCTEGNHRASTNPFEK